MAPAPALMSVQEYFTKTPLSRTPTELVHGALRVADAPTPRHQSAVAELFRALDAHVRQRHLGRMWLAPLDVVLSERLALIVQPDLFFVSNERDWIVTDRVRGAPDLVIEVLSPNPRIGKTEERVQWFADHGVRECWLIQQDQRAVTVIQCAESPVSRRRFSRDEGIVSTVLPEFHARLADILE